MNKAHKYKVSVNWTGNQGTGTSSYKAYSRNYSISTEQKKEILGSSDPAFLGDLERYNPEEFLVMSLSSCHMLWYLHLCAEAGVIVLEYNDNAMGNMVEDHDGGGHFTAVRLNPIVVVAENSMINNAHQIHNQAHKMCFIARSVNFPVSIVPLIETR